tara:strand:+ start:503 stop:649 length:147 start_codon:yes stop_codon:yes gene_type:complete
LATLITIFIRAHLLNLTLLNQVKKHRNVEIIQKIKKTVKDEKLFTFLY